jgi:hypothetical protein
LHGLELHALSQVRWRPTELSGLPRNRWSFLCHRQVFSTLLLHSGFSRRSHNLLDQKLQAGILYCQSSYDSDSRGNNCSLDRCHHPNLGLHESGILLTRRQHRRGVTDLLLVEC